MFFQRRRWALRVIEQMGLPVRSPAAAELVAMIMEGAKQSKQMTGTVGVKISEPERVLMTVAIMSDNRSAFERLSREGLDAIQLLADARDAGRNLSVENGFHDLVSRFYNRLPDLNAEALSRKPTPIKAMVDFHRQEMEENLAAARNMPSDIRKLLVKDLALTYFQIDDGHTPDGKLSTLQSLMTFALEKRHDALKSGAESRDNPQWNVASCIESIAFGEIAVLKSLEIASEAHATRVAVQSFISENATAEEIASMQTKYRTRR